MIPFKIFFVINVNESREGKRKRDRERGISKFASMNFLFDAGINGVEHLISAGVVSICMECGGRKTNSKPAMSEIPKPNRASHSNVSKTCLPLWKIV